MEKRSYFGCRIRQREDTNTVTFFIFYARVKDVKEWAGIRRVGTSSEGTQRLLRETRKKAITRFLRANPENTIPNNILLAFESDQTRFTPLDQKINQSISNFDIHNGCESLLEWGILEFEFDSDLNNDDSFPAFVVDGQHRLYGMSEYEKENLPVLIVSLLDASVEEQAFQFIVINNKAVRVPTENVKSIIANIDEEKLQRSSFESRCKVWKYITCS